MKKIMIAVLWISVFAVLIFRHEPAQAESLCPISKCMKMAPSPVEKKMKERIA